MNKNRDDSKASEATQAGFRWRFSVLSADADDDAVNAFIERLRATDEEFAACGRSDERDETHTTQDRQADSL